MKKTYLILGASSEVGMCYMEKLISTDEDMVIVAVYRTMSDRFMELISADVTAQIVAIRADLSVEEDVDSLIESIKNEGLEPTHILHLAASKFDYIKIKNWDSRQAMVDLQVSYLSFAKVCSAFVPVMAKAKYGKVLAMLTAYTLGTPPKYMSNYIAAKYALLGYIKSLATEYADKGLNINGISPNMMETRFINDIDERIVEMTAQNSSKKRNVTVKETVDAMYWLMSDEASYVNGTNFNLSGGDYM